jgi:hypothetical protein
MSDWCEIERKFWAGICVKPLHQMGFEARGVSSFVILASGVRDLFALDGFTAGRQ